MKKSFQKVLSLLLVCLFVLTGFSVVFAEEDVLDSGIEEDSGVSVGMSGDGIMARGIPDSTPPVLTEISIDKTTVGPGGTITVRGSGTDDISGVSNIDVCFTDEENNRACGPILYDNDNDGIFEGTMTISQYELDGTFELDWVDITDNAGNRQRYYSKNYPYLDEDDLLLPQEWSFKVINDPNAIVSNTENPNLAQQLKDQPEGSKAMIAYESSPHISADVFEAIKGQDKELVLEGDGIQWVFNGNDVDSPKSLDLNVEIDKIDYTNSANRQELQQAMGDQNALVLTFPNNGKLPGKALIRAKMDYAFRKYLGEENLYVYYYNSVNKKMELVAANIDLRADGWIEFTIDHNSDFVITLGAIGDPKPEKPEQSKPEKPDSSDDSDDFTETTGGQSGSIKDNPHTGAY